MPITTNEGRYYIVDLACANKAGIDTEYMRKSHDGTLVMFQDTQTTSLQLTMVSMYCSMMSKMPIAIDADMLLELIEADENWKGTEVPEELIAE